MAKKSMIIAIILSIIWSGLGLIYAGETKMGIMLAVAALIFDIVCYFVFAPAGIVVFIIWIYSLYLTYNQVNAVNGV